MTWKRVAAGVAAGAIVAIGAGPAWPAGAVTESGVAVLRGAHLSPDTPSVDVYLTAFAGHTTTLWLTSVGYGDVSPYRQVKPGFYAVSMRKHGASASSPAALSWTADLRPGHAYTAAAVGMNSQLHGIVVGDELKPPSSGNGRVRVIQAASRLPHAKVYAANGPVLAASAAFGTTTPYTTVPAGNWAVHATSVSSPRLTTTSDITIHSGSVESLAVLDAKGGGVTIRPLVDAAGARAVPAGAVPAGGGGTAPGPSGPSLPIIAATVALIGVIAGAALRLGRRAVGTG